MITVKIVEDLANMGEDIATVLAALVACVAYDVQLDIEEFFELQSYASLL